ncbi:LysM receptor kinase [Melia azedarach]|uniref:LysM receptor kinase n=1 Tax=Melia azedarach TaxID=155640 RepID=A0ACC1XU92_MELAZ|nr:LysM receptor kinase [Melia azedarach]
MSNMDFLSYISVFTLFIICFWSLIQAQQPYIGLDTTACFRFDNTNSALGYSCNGLNRSCQAYLIFRSISPYDTVASISKLLASDPAQLSKINSVSETATFENNKVVIVPVNCSCSGQHYQVNTTYVVEKGDTYLLIANNTFQGLSTCQAIQDQRSNVSNFGVGSRVLVPLRCACPTKNQTDSGVHYLLSYLVKQGDSVGQISKRFGVDTGRTLAANGLSFQNTIIQPFTTLLVPLEKPPSSSQTKETLPTPSSLTSPPPPPPPPDSSSNDSSKKTWIYVVVGVLTGIVLTLIFGTIIFHIFFRERNKKEPDSSTVSISFEACEKPVNKKLDEESQDFIESLSDIAQSLKVYSFRELESATENFSSSCWIEGSVYRGKVNGHFAAIKKVNGDVSEEINLLNKINHSNLIRLSGVCFNDGNWYLVYEYAVNGSLNDWIYGNNGEKFLNWAQRIRIALDVAEGLNYLHSFTSPPHIHKDIKSSNVLLDSDFRAKIANFALARQAERQEGEFALTSHIVGTKGYIAPEYLENGLVSTKLDVYAFGVLMLEMLTGKEAAALYTEENVHLSDVLNPLLNKNDEEESLKHFIDPSMQGIYPSEIAILVIKLIDSCLKKAPDRSTNHG